MVYMVVVLLVDAHYMWACLACVKLSLAVAICWLFHAHGVELSCRELVACGCLKRMILRLVACLPCVIIGSLW